MMENFRRAGAFEFRRAFNAIIASPELRRRGIVAYSSGNDAIAVPVLVMPLDAPGTKFREVVMEGRSSATI